MAEYKIEISDEDFQKINQLAKARGVTANTVISQAIATEKLIADHVDTKDDLLIRKGDTLNKIILKR